MKIKTIEPHETKNDKITLVIDMVPMLKRNIGFGYVTEREATPEDFKKYPLVLQPWVRKEGL